MRGTTKGHIAARRAVAIPLLLVGGLLWIATLVGAVAGNLYFAYQGITDLLDGDIASGLVTTFVVTTAVTAASGLAAGIAMWLVSLGGNAWEDANDRRADGVYLGNSAS